MKKTAIITFIIAVVLITVTLLGNATNHKKVVDSTSQSSKIKISATKKQSIISKSQSSSLISSSSSATIGQSVNEDSSSSTSSSAANDPNTASYNPNKTAQGTEVTAEMITKVRQELIRAGLPADKWGPSDIKKIITESSQQNMSVIDYAKANYHQ